MEDEEAQAQQQAEISAALLPLLPGVRTRVLAHIEEERLAKREAVAVSHRDHDFALVRRARHELLVLERIVLDVLRRSPLLPPAPAADRRLRTRRRMRQLSSRRQRITSQRIRHVRRRLHDGAARRCAAAQRSGAAARWPGAALRGSAALQLLQRRRNATQWQCCESLACGAAAALPSAARPAGGTPAGWVGGRAARGGRTGTGWSRGA
jgi:hypothetical protein